MWMRLPALLRNAAVGLRAFVDPPKPAAMTYVNGAKIATLAVILTIAILPDGFLLWILMPQRLWWLAALIDVADVWTCVWAFAVYGTMVARPHELYGDRIVFHNGALGCAQVNVIEIAGASVLGEVKRRALPRSRGDKSQVLAPAGVPVVEVELKNGRKIFVGSDAPQQLLSALHERIQ